MKRIIYLAASFAAVALSAVAQDQVFDPKGGFAVEVSLENSLYLRLPIYRNAITSLSVVGDYVIGGTSAGPGLTPYLFAVSLSKRRLEMVAPLDETVTGQRSIQSGFGRGPDGSLYAGTIPQVDGGNGHLIRTRVDGNRIDVVDLGVPVPTEGVFAVTAGPKAGAIYGVSYPAGRFFVFTLATGKTDIYDQTVPQPAVLSNLKLFLVKPEDYLSRRLVLDSEGRVYGSCPPNKIFRFDPEAKKLELLKDELPEVVGRWPLGRVDSWAVAPDGVIYGGNAGDGQLFRLHPSSGRMANLGKPAMMPRMKGIAFGRDGRLYGVTGSTPGYAHVFTFDSIRGFTDLGIPQSVMKAPGIEQGIPWRGFQIGTVAASEDGRYIVMGEEEALSQLLVFPVD